MDLPLHETQHKLDPESKLKTIINKSQLEAPPILHESHLFRLT